MNKYKLYLLACLLIQLILTTGCAEKKNNVSQRVLSNCTLPNKIDSLMQEIVLIPNLYNSKADRMNENYIIGEMLPIVNKSFKGYFDKVFKVRNKVEPGSIINVIHIDSLVFNSDSSQVNVQAGYNDFGKLREYTLHVTYEFNPEYCNWRSIKYSNEVH